MDLISRYCCQCVCECAFSGTGSAGAWAEVRPNMATQEADRNTDNYLETHNSLCNNYEQRRVSTLFHVKPDKEEMG